MPWWRCRQRELDLERELRSDLELEAEEQSEKGFSGEEARYAARRALGNTSLLKEDVRAAWGWTRWEILLQDFGYAVRTLRKSPAFALTALLTLALGIGASTAVFTVVDSIVLEPLAYRDGGACAAKKLAAAAKKCIAFAKCYASAAKKADMFTPNAACLSSASGKFSIVFSPSTTSTGHVTRRQYCAAASRRNG